MATDEKFIFYPHNLIENIHRLGGWSSYGLAVTALRHYFPEEYDTPEEGDSPPVKREVELLHKLGCEYWSDAIIKYQTEIGYDAPNGFHPEAVNEY